jgi:transcriptional regulator with XRE-family HTH domain
MAGGLRYPSVAINGLSPHSWVSITVEESIMQEQQMNLDTTRIREEREKRAWTQEQLAEVANLGLRTVQRIEATGVASFESAASLSSALSISISDLRLKVATNDATSLFQRLKANASVHMRSLFAALLVALIVSPPMLAAFLLIFLSLCTAYVGGVAMASKRQTF